MLNDLVVFYGDDKWRYGLRVSNLIIIIEPLRDGYTSWQGS